MEAHRIALISDLHGNHIALREVLRAIGRSGADEIVCLGDVATLGFAPAEVVDTLQQLGCRCVMGNHDDYLLDPLRVDAHSELPIVADAIHWSRAELSADQLRFVAGFEPGFDLSLGEGQRLMLFHGSPSSNVVDLLADTPSEQFDEQLGPERATLMAGGHTHVQMLRQHRGTRVVNPGSVGAPFREFAHGAPPVILDHAEYATVEARDGEIGVTLHRVGLDRAELARAARDSASPMRAFLQATYA